MVQAKGHSGSGPGWGGPRGVWGCFSYIAGIYQYETISCSNCTDSHVICFGYYCKSSAQWESAVQGLLKYINTWHKQDEKMR
uniref:Isoform 2 of Izumo sperm-egg fusion protein 4 n=1 Tax=Mus musculus TaxID=10090 RepID=D3Z690-2|nr:9030607L17Rik protein [Mus musculus]